MIYGHLALVNGWRENYDTQTTIIAYNRTISLPRQFPAFQAEYLRCDNQPFRKNASTDIFSSKGSNRCGREERQQHIPPSASQNLSFHSVSSVHRACTYRRSAQYQPQGCPISHPNSVSQSAQEKGKWQSSVISKENRRHLGLEVILH